MDPKKTAFAVAAAICIGTIPLFGLTFITAVCFGLIFRLNQFIMQAVHILMSPLQIIFFYPFVRAGQFVFGLDSALTMPVKQIPDYIFNHTCEFISKYLKVMMAATCIWLIASLIAGYIIYRVGLVYFSRLVGLSNPDSQVSVIFE
jgi:uncharacterized protein (DUF2062 family)